MCTSVCAHIIFWHSIWIIKIHREVMAYFTESTKHQREDLWVVTGSRKLIYWKISQRKKIVKIKQTVDFKCKTSN